MTFSSFLLYQALDSKRRELGISWTQVAALAGVVPSTLTRVSNGHHPNVAGLVALLAWLGETDLKPYLQKREE